MTCPDSSTPPLRYKNSYFSDSCLRISKYCIQTKFCICETEIILHPCPRETWHWLWNKALLMVLSSFGLFHCSALLHSLCLFPLIPFKIYTQSMWDGPRANNKKDFFLILRDVLYQHVVLGQKTKHDFFLPLCQCLLFIDSNIKEHWIHAKQLSFFNLLWQQLKHLCWKLDFYNIMFTRKNKNKNKDGVLDWFA